MAGGISLSARSITSRCPANVPATRLSCWIDGDDVVPLLVEDSDEIVQPGEQLADLGFASGQRGVEVVDDVADLPEPAPVDDRRQRRQRLLGGRVGRRRVQRDGGARLQPPRGSSPSGGFSARCIEPEQAGLPDRGYHVGRDRRHRA